MKNNLVEDAIADAKALKESAIENAKLALQEKFMPKLEELIEEQVTEEQIDETQNAVFVLLASVTNCAA